MEPFVWLQAGFVEVIAAPVGPVPEVRVMVVE